MSTDALFMPPTPRLGGDKELPPCPDLVGHPQNGTMPFVGGWSPSMYQSSQGWSSTPGSASLLVPKSVQFVDTTQYSVGGPFIAGDAHAAGWGAVQPVIPRMSGAPENRVPHTRGAPYNNGAPRTTRGSPHTRIPHNVLDGGVGVRGGRSTLSVRPPYGPYTVVPEIVIPDYERPARHVNHSTWGPPSSYSRSSYGPGEDPFPKISFWRRVARMLFCRA